MLICGIERADSLTITTATGKKVIRRGFIYLNKILLHLLLDVIEDVHESKLYLICNPQIIIIIIITVMKIIIRVATRQNVPSDVHPEKIQTSLRIRAV